MKKRLFTRIMSLLLIVISALPFTACTVSLNGLVLYKEGIDYQETKKGTPLPYYTRTYEIMGGEDVMPFGGYYGLYGSGGSIDGNSLPNYADEKYFQLTSELGLNFVTYVPGVNGSPEKLEQWYTLGDKYGIGMFTTCDEILNNFMSGTDPRKNANFVAPTKEWIYDLVSKYSLNFSHKSFMGLFAFDEPSMGWKMEYWNEVCKAFYDCNFPKGIDLYCNILGYWTEKQNINNAFEGGGCYYTEYTETGRTITRDGAEVYIPGFMKSGVQVLSSTEYPFNSKVTDYKAVSDWFQAMSYMVKLANKYGIPYWRMMQAGAVFGRHVKDDPYPWEGQLFLDMNSALAFGCKGIQFYPIHASTSLNTMDDGSLYFEWQGLFGGDGQKNPYFDYAKTAGVQLKAVDDVLMHCANVGILPHGDKAKSLIGKLNGELITDNGWRELSSISGDDCFVGCFDYKGGTALYVVNNSCEEKSSFTLKFNGNYRYDVTQRGERVSVVGRNIPLTLNPGEGVLVTLY